MTSGKRLPMLDARLRTRLAPADLETRRGKVLGTADYDLLLTGAARLAKPDNRPLCVYLPGVLVGELGASGVYEILHGLRGRTDNRGLASGTPRIASQQTRSRSRNVPSMIVGAVDPARLVHTCQLPGKPARTLLVDPFDSPSAAVLRPGLYRHYRSRYIETGDPVWLAGMLDHVGPETEPPPEPSLPTASTRGSLRLAALTTTIATIMFLACIAWMLLRGFGVL